MNEKARLEGYLSQSEDNDDVDLLKVFRFILMQSKLIIAIVLVGFIVSFSIYSVSTKKYSIKSLLQFEPFDQSIFDPSNALQSTSSPSSNISNMIALYESRTNYLKVILDLKLNIKIQDLDNDEYVDIEIISERNGPLKIHDLEFTFSESGYTLLNSDLNKIQTSNYGDQIIYDDLTISIKSVRLNEYRPIDISFRYPESMYKMLKSRIMVTSNVTKNAFLEMRD